MSVACCVPLCDSNNSTSSKYISIFSFPDDPARKQLWLSKIRRKNFIPPKRLGVCIKHFEERFILSKQPSNGSEDKNVVVHFRNMRLTKDAYPTVLHFEDSSKPFSIREMPDTENKRIEDYENSEFSLNEDDKIVDIATFRLRYQSKLPSNWLTLPSDNDIYIARMNFENNPELMVTIKIKHDLAINVWYKNSPVQSEEFQWLFGKKLKLMSWTQFESLVQYLNDIDCNTLDMQMKGMMNLLEDCAKECVDKKIQTKLLSIADHVKFLSFLQPVSHVLKYGKLEAHPKARKTITKDT